MKKLDKLVQLQKRIEDSGIQMVDLKFVDLIGKFRHVTLPARSVNESLLTEGVGFDGSSVGFKSVKSGDMCLIPDLDTAFIDPFWERSTISMLCDIVEADSRIPFMGDPRSVTRRTLDYAVSQKLAGNVFMLPELEFNVMDKVTYEVSPHRSIIDIQCRERNGISDDETNPLCGHWIPAQQGYHRAPPQDYYRDVRAQVVEHLESIGVDVKYHHHEVGATGQQEIELTLAPVMDACDRTMLTKYFVHNVAVDNGVTATFMPKPIAGEAGNGLHMHFRMTDKQGKPLFYDGNDPIGLSEIAYCFIGGIIRHGRSLAAFTNPSVNSYRRLIPGFEAPTNLFFSMGSRNSAIRIPKYANAPDKKRFEIRCPDATCNIYFAASAIMMAGFDGVKNGIHAGKNGWGPYNDIRLESRSVQRRIPSLPVNLDEALTALEKDHDYLRENNVFSQQLIDGWILTRRQRELIPIQQTPTPIEYQLYFSC